MGCQSPASASGSRTERRTLPLSPLERQQETERIVEEWQGPVYGLARRILGNDADAADATQEIFLRVFRKLDTLDRSRPIKPWIFRVAAHHLQNCIRAREARRRREAACMRHEPGSQDP